MTHVNVYLAPGTYHRLWTAHMYMHREVIIPRWRCLLLLIVSHQTGFANDLFWQLVNEIAWYIYVFIYLSFFLNLLYTVSEKKELWFWIWINWRSCTKCSETNRLKWSKMPTYSEDTGRCNFILCRFVLKRLVFYLHWIPQWPSWRRQCKSYLSGFEFYEWTNVKH